MFLHKEIINKTCDKIHSVRGYNTANIVQRITRICLSLSENSDVDICQTDTHPTLIYKYIDKFDSIGNMCHHTSQLFLSTDKSYTYM